MVTRMGEKLIARGRGAVARLFVLVGVLFFGPLVGLGTIMSADMSNHPAWHKALVLAACIILVGPAWGFLSGYAFWYFFLRRKRVSAEQDAAPLPSEGESSEAR